MTSNDRATRCLVIGGGVGGLAAGIGLKQIGIDVSVFERARDLAQAQVGGAFTMYANAMHPLTKLGLGSEVRAAGSLIERVELRGWNGTVYTRRTLDALSRRWNAPTVGISRTNMHRILTGRFGEDDLHMNTECTGFEQHPGGVTAHFVDRASESGDFLVGADGSRSMLRTQEFPESKRRYAGYTVWQGIAEDFEHEAIPEDMLVIWYGRALRLCMYHVGRGRPYWAVLLTTPEGGRDPAGGSKQAALSHFVGWQEPIEAMIEATPDAAISRMDNYGGVPLAQWGRGRATLLGDAAHPTTIDVGQGACQAIEDAFALKEAVASKGDLEAALREYEYRRIPRTTKVMETAWRVGRVGQTTNPLVLRFRRYLMGIGWDRHLKLLSTEERATTVADPST